MHRLASLARTVPLVVDVALDRAAVLTPLAPIASALTVTFGVSDAGLLDALTGTMPPIGRLPIGLPASMDAVRAVESDAGLPPEACLYPVGAGLSLPTEDG
ncbi:hypothetical protein [Tessaracoccus defluvii]|uniref:hypothetical protein n=1 Tax=Tessaracoccus defluvii TaxID=1285901 RepID=UPI0031D3A453